MIGFDPLIYSKEIKVDSTRTKDQLYNSFIQCFGSNKVSSQNKIQEQDKTTGKIRGTGVVKVFSNGLVVPKENDIGYVTYSITITVKEGSYEYLIDNIYHHGFGKYPDGGDLGRNRPGKAYVGEKMMMRPLWIQIVDQGKAGIESTIISFKNCAKKI